MRVAVCDKDPLAVERIKKILDDTEGVDGCDGYAGLPLLLDAMERGERYRLAILSVDGEGGSENLESAGTLQLLDGDTRIIYMTEHPLLHIQQIFLQPAAPSGFLIKPVDEALLQRYIDNIRGVKTDGGLDRLVLKSKKGICSVRFGEILYMESESHIISVHTRTGRHSCYGRLEKLLQQLPENFIQCHKSYIVNMREIIQIERSGIRMENGLVIPVSKSRYSNTKSRYMNYVE